jgi:hypothetical protein
MVHQPAPPPPAPAPAPAPVVARVTQISPPPPNILDAPKDKVHHSMNTLMDDGK